VFDFSLLDAQSSDPVDPDEFVRAAMQWHFDPATGSRFWLDRAKDLDFDPVSDVKGFADLRLFPNLINELRDVAVEDLIPAGIVDPKIQGVYESGGTTGAPKRVVFHAEWLDFVISLLVDVVDREGFPAGGNWLTLVPTGPHMIGEFGRQLAERHGGIRFSVDFDPRWVKKVIARGDMAEADAYADHIVNQAADILRTQDVKVLVTTPPLLERMVRDDELLELIQRKVKAIIWGGAHMDADSRHLFRTQVLPTVKLLGFYCSTTVLGGSQERSDTVDDRCVFDPMSHHISFEVIDPETGRHVSYGERGQVVMHHLSKFMLLPNNLERDTAIRIQPRSGQLGDSVADVQPVASFDNAAVIEGVY
jgi:phenylacetate-coenzyme A ligase PaaK-like adenylate-forming protein